VPRANPRSALEICPACVEQEHGASPRSAPVEWTDSCECLFFFCFQQVVRPAAGPAPAPSSRGRASAWESSARTSTAPFGSTSRPNRSVGSSRARNRRRRPGGDGTVGSGCRCPLGVGTPRGALAAGAVARLAAGAVTAGRWSACQRPTRVIKDRPEDRQAICALRSLVSVGRLVRSISANDIRSGPGSPPQGSGVCSEARVAWPTTLPRTRRAWTDRRWAFLRAGGQGDTGFRLLGPAGTGSRESTRAATGVIGRGGGASTRCRAS